MTQTDYTGMDAVSLYGKGTVPGDTAVEVKGGGLAAGSAALTLKAQGTATTTVVTNTLVTAVTGIDRYRRLTVLLDVSAVLTDVDDILKVYIDFSPDSGVTWVNGCRFADVLGNGTAKKFVAVFDPSSPGTAPIDVTSDCAAGVVRPSVFGNQVRVRYTTEDPDGTPDLSFTWKVVALGQS